MTLKEQIMKLQTYKMYRGEDTVYVDRDDVIKALEQEPCEDCISRRALLDNLEKPMNWTDNEAELQEQRDYEGFIELVQSMPSVTPQPKMGRWLAKSFHEVYCDNCGFDFDIMRNEFIDKMKYCPNCGAKMEEGRDEE